MTEPRYDRLPPRVPDSKSVSTSMAAIGGGPLTAPAPPAAASTSLSRNERGAALTAQCPPGGADIANCNLPVWVTLFFDGTGNNRQNDTPTFEHSNVARMFNAHRLRAERDGIFPFYIPGIGT